MIADVITLVQETYKTDGIGQKIPDETIKTEVFATRTSVSRSEWFAAQNIGLDVQFVFITPSVNYNGQQYAEYNGKRYLIYRTYNNGQDTELYLGQRGGVHV